MEIEENKIGEQPQEELPAESLTEQPEITSQHEELSGSPYGKFKTPEALFKAYTDLEKEFTKKCQRMKELSESSEKGISTESVPQYRKENWPEVVKQFFVSHPEAVPFADDISGVLSGDKTIAVSDRSLELALIKTKADKYRTEEELMRDEQFVKTYVLTNSKVREKVISDYLNGIVNSQSAPLIFEAGGSFTSAPREKPKNIAEAGRLAEALFKI